MAWNMDMEHGNAARTCTWIMDCNIDFKHGQAAETSSINMRHGHASWPWTCEWTSHGHAVQLGHEHGQRHGYGRGQGHGREQRLLLDRQIWPELLGNS